MLHQTVRAKLLCLVLDINIFTNPSYTIINKWAPTPNNFWIKKQFFGCLFWLIGCQKMNEL